MLEDAHHVRKQKCGVARVIYIYEFVGSVQILLLSHGQVEWLRFVHGPFHLVDVPVGSEEGSVGYSYVCPYFLDFLSIPQRECIIVSMCHQDSVRSY